MDAFFDKLMTDYGLLGIFLSGVVAYFLRAEVVFWRERENYKQSLQSAHDNFTGILRDRLAEQQAVVKTLTESLDNIVKKTTESIEKMEVSFHDAEMEFIKLQETILSKLEQMQMQRNMASGSQK